MNRNIYFGLIILITVLFAVSVWAIWFRRVTPSNACHDNYEKTTRTEPTCRTINDYLNRAQYRKAMRVLTAVVVVLVLVCIALLAVYLFKRFRGGGCGGGSHKQTSVDAVAFPPAPDAGTGGGGLEGRRFPFETTSKNKSARFSPFAGVASSRKTAVPAFTSGNKMSVASSVYGNVKIPKSAVFNQVSDSL